MLSKMRTTLMVGAVAVAAGTTTSVGVDGMKLQARGRNRGRVGARYQGIREQKIAAAADAAYLPRNADRWVDITETGRIVRGPAAYRRIMWFRKSAERAQAPVTTSLPRGFPLFKKPGTNEVIEAKPKVKHAAAQAEPKKVATVKWVEMERGNMDHDDAPSPPPSAPGSFDENEGTPPSSPTARAQTPTVADLAQDVYFMRDLETLKTSFIFLDLNLSEFASETRDMKWEQQSRKIQELLVKLRKNAHLGEAIRLLEQGHVNLDIPVDAMGKSMRLSEVLRVIGTGREPMYNIKRLAPWARVAFNDFYVGVKSAEKAETQRVTWEIAIKGNSVRELLQQMKYVDGAVLVNSKTGETHNDNMFRLVKALADKELLYPVLKALRKEGLGNGYDRLDDFEENEVLLSALTVSNALDGLAMLSELEFGQFNEGLTKWLVEMASALYPYVEKFDTFAYGEIKRRTDYIYETIPAKVMPASREPARRRLFGLLPPRRG